MHSLRASYDTSPSFKLFVWMLEKRETAARPKSVGSVSPSLSLPGWIVGVLGGMIPPLPLDEDEDETGYLESAFVSNPEIPRLRIKLGFDSKDEERAWFKGSRWMQSLKQHAAQGLKKKKNKQQQQLLFWCESFWRRNW